VLDVTARQTPSPLLVFLTFAGLILAALLVAAVLSPPVFQLLERFPIHRVFNRIAMVTFLVGFAFLLARLSLTSREALGYGVSRRNFLRSMVSGFLAGTLLLGIVAGLLLSLGVRTWSPASSDPLVSAARLLPMALLSGFTVGFVEETFFRGALYGALRRQGSFALALVLTSLLYSSVHFLGERFRIPAADVDWRSGFVLLGNFFNAWRHPLAIADGVIALALVGALFALVRERMGHIGAAVGLHAGCVCVILLIRKTSTVVESSRMSFLVGDRDGIVGWLVAFLAATVLFAAWKWWKPSPRS
jgi:membrane protease YdiL (CAAX protease family)